MKINNKEVKGSSFAYDNCHKIYIIEDDSDEVAAKKLGYQIYNLKYLKSSYENSCSLKFIYNWKLNIVYVNQFEEAIFEDDRKRDDK
jgi:hypothetical protein